MTATTESERLPLSALLSHALVAFTIEFDNESEHRMAHRTTRHGLADSARDAPWLVSMAMWLNCMRFVDEKGLTVAELQRRACTPTNLNGMRRWGYIVVGKDSVIRPTSKGRRAQDVWRPLTAAIEERWRERFGRETIEVLRALLDELVDACDLDLPDSLPILGYGLFSNRFAPAPRPPEARGKEPANRSVPALLAKVLLMFALEFERESHVSLAISANILRIAGNRDLRVRDLPRLAGISKEAIAMALGFLTRGGYAVVGSGEGRTRVKILELTLKGHRAREHYRNVIAAIEQRWDERHEERMALLRRSLERLVGEPTAHSPLFAGLEPYPDGWRAAVARAQALPHFPTVLHRGGWPDGS